MIDPLTQQPMPTTPLIAAEAVAKEVAADLGPTQAQWFLAGAAVFLAALFLITYVAALAGNHLAQQYLASGAAPLVLFLTGWLGMPSPFTKR